ncbi:MAG: DNA mismatch repair protein MutS [Chlamydiales bacterium]|nr:DNA mismatch repair protein MutS [Chlamydiales bacterium]
MTPMMQQWHDCKKSQPDAILLFRLGDFYEAFYEDAKTLSKELDLTLTQRQGTPMSGIPYHAAEGYIEKMVTKGYLIAIAEQTSDPKLSKGLVERKIVRTVSLGTTLSETLVSSKTHNYFACITQVNSTIGLALLDHSTGELSVSELDSIEALESELFRCQPKELLSYGKAIENKQALLDELYDNFKTRIILKDPYLFDHQSAYNFLTDHFKVLSLDGFGLKGLCAAINAAGGLLTYLRDHLTLCIDHIENINALSLNDYMSIDKTTQAGLELISSLLPFLDRTCTPMGARMMRSWLTHPLLNPDQIKARQQAAQELKPFEDLKNIRDLERIVTRLGSGYGSPRDLLALRTSLEVIPNMQAHLSAMQSPLLKSLPWPDLAPLCSLIARAITDNPPLRLSDGGVIRPGFSEELDDLLHLKQSSQNFLAQYQNKLRDQLGIKTLRVTFNKAFGYSIEVSRGQSQRMPETFHKRQTLVNAERFTSPELKEYEDRILGAEEKITTLETTLYNQVKETALKARKDILIAARSIAHFDCLLSFAKLKSNMTFPTVDSSDLLYIEGGRHPVIEQALCAHTFIPNDTHLDAENRLFLITGPNMAGKSTYIRQVAIIAIMAQIGAPIPATKAHIGIIDKVFSRIGASDDLKRGQSTFMVEMSETANILRNATPRSLVILDEIGRGTSTYDGVAIAWAVAEYLLTQKTKRAKTLFATHYFELTAMEGKIPGAINYNVAVHEAADKITFLHKIKRGDTDKSYGIHVARLAGLPAPAIEKARQMLCELETGKRPKKQDAQLSLFETPTPSPILEELKTLNTNQLTPMQALQKLCEWQNNL